MEPQTQTHEITPVPDASSPDNTPDRPDPPPVGDLPLNPAPPAEPPRTPGRMTQSELDQYDATTVRLVTAKMEEVDAANKEYESVNGESKSLKVKWQGLDESLHALIRERREARGKPVQKTLIDVADEATREAAALAPAAETGPDPLEDLWKQYPMDRLTIHGMTAKDVEKLKAGTRSGGESMPLMTMGQVANYTANPDNPGYERRLTDFVGIGLGAATRISDAMIAFWSYWNAGGREEYAAELGLTTNATDTAGRAGAVGEGGDGHVPSEPEGPAAGDPPAADPAREAEAAVYAGEPASDEVPIG